MILLNIEVPGIIAIHTSEAWSWAALFLWPDREIFSTFESMGGLILFGAGTGFSLELMRNLFSR